MNISKTKEFLKDTFDNSEYLNTNKREQDYRFHHSLRVAKWGQRIAEAENLNVEALTIACILHDIAYSEEMTSREMHMDHGRRSAELSVDFINTLDIEESLKKDILYGIGSHVDNKTNCGWNPSVLSDSVSDADNLDRFDTYRIYESLEFDKFSLLSNDEKIEYVNKRLANISKLENHALATKTATNYFLKMLAKMKSFFESLLVQLHNSL